MRSDWISLGGALRLLAGVPEPALPCPGEPARFAEVPAEVRAERERAMTAACAVLRCALADGRVTAWGYAVSDPGAPIGPDQEAEAIPIEWWLRPDALLVPVLGGSFLEFLPPGHGGGRRRGYAHVVLARKQIDALVARERKMRAEEARRARQAAKPDPATVVAWMNAFIAREARRTGVPPKREDAIAQCCADLKVTWRDALAGWRAVPTERKRSARESDHALVRKGRFADCAR